MNRAMIAADLNCIRALGFNHIRFIPFVSVNDPFYSSWPSANFLTFPSPSESELGALRQFFSLIGSLGLSYEIVLSMPDSKNLYYQNGVSSGDYRTFIERIFEAAWSGPLARVFLGGDLHLGDIEADRDLVANHRRFLSDLWPFLYGVNPSCAFGIEVAGAYSTLWDAAASSIEWIKSSIVPLGLPHFVGSQFYPSTHANLIATGYEKDGIIDWAGLTRSWILGLRGAAGPIPIVVDEIGLEVGREFSEGDQAAFLSAALMTINLAGVDSNVWEFSDHPGIGNFGLFRQSRTSRPALSSLPPFAGGLLRGIQYAPPEFDDLAFLMPDGTPLPLEFNP
jgi:hypothetical protein